MNEFYFAALVGITFGVFGFSSGMYYEATYGSTAKELDRYHRMVMRMIVKLRFHHSNKEILELIHPRMKSDACTPS